jgi:signal transduction histidine kinase
MSGYSFMQGKTSTFLAGAGVLFVLYLTSLYSYLLFHTLVEIFSVAVACGIFMFAWNSRRFLDNNYLLLIGIAYIFVAAFDLLHALAYKNMGVFPGFDSNLPTQLWIAARYVQSLSLLAAPLFLSRKLRPRLAVAGYSAVAAMLLLSIFIWRVFPDCFVEGVGLTPFKKLSECALVGILAASLLFMLRKRRAFHREVVQLLASSIVLLMLAELAFSLYIDVYGITNMVGHFFKVVAFFLIYKAMIETGLAKPYNLLFWELQQAKEELEQRVAERTSELAETLQKLKKEFDERVNAEKALIAETAERIRTMEDLREKEQMLILQGRQAAMGEMIGNIAHQWRQPLNTLGLLVQQTRMFYELGQFSQEFLESNVNRSMEIIQHMSRTIDDFRNYFKPEKEKVEFKMYEAVAKTLTLVEGSLNSKRVDIEIAAKCDPHVFGYPNEFLQVLLNILINARDALTERVVGDPRVLITIDSAGDRAVLTIADNAGGIPEEIMDRIFEPYFTTKGPQAGTGVGLFMSKTIVEKNMGGRLSARNTPDGAEFRIEV